MTGCSLPSQRSRRCAIHVSLLGTLTATAVLGSGCATTVNEGILPPPPRSSVAVVRPTLPSAGAVESLTLRVDTTAPRRGWFPPLLTPATDAGTAADSAPEIGRGALTDTTALGFRLLGADAVADSVRIHAAWPALHLALRPGARAVLREGVWPNPFVVTRRALDSASLATDWVPARRLPAAELRCLTGRPAMTADARYVATVHRSGGVVRLRVTLEARGLEKCDVSTWADDRVRAATRDLWLTLARAAVSGTGTLRP